MALPERLRITVDPRVVDLTAPVVVTASQNGIQIQFTKRKDSDREIAAAPIIQASKPEKKEPLFNYHKKIDAMLFPNQSFDLFADYEKLDASQDDLKKALFLAQEGIDYGFDKDPGHEIKEKASLYYKKAIIEFSLFDGEISRSINTINSGVDFINKNIERIDDENTTRKIINNYKSRLGILKDRYRATLNVAGIIETTDKLIAQKQFGQAETVLEDALLDVEKKSSDPIENFKYRMQILSRLVRVESMQGLKKNVLGYIDYGLDQVIKPLLAGIQMKKFYRQTQILK
jgi:hypothetical protein